MQHILLNKFQNLADSIHCTSQLSDGDSNDNVDEILKSFASDEKVDASFAGFSKIENINDLEFDNSDAQILIAESI